MSAKTGQQLIAAAGVFTPISESDVLRWLNAELNKAVAGQATNASPTLAQVAADLALLEADQSPKTLFAIFGQLLLQALNSASNMLTYAGAPNGNVTANAVPAICIDTGSIPGSIIIWAKTTNPGTNTGWIH